MNFFFLKIKMAVIKKFIRLVRSINNTDLEKCIQKIKTEYQIDDSIINSILHDLFMTTDINRKINYEKLLKGNNKDCLNRETKHGINIDLYDKKDLTKQNNICYSYTDCKNDRCKKNADMRPIPIKLIHRIKNKECPTFERKGNTALMIPEDNYINIDDSYVSSLSANNITMFSVEPNYPATIKKIYDSKNDNESPYKGPFFPVFLNDRAFKELKNFMSEQDYSLDDETIKYFDKLNYKPTKPIKVYRGFNFLGPKNIEITGAENPKIGMIIDIPHKRSHSWSSNKCIAIQFAAGIDNLELGLVFSTILEPKDIIIDTRMINSKDILKLYHHTQSEIIAKPGTYKSKLEYIVYSKNNFIDFYGKKPLPNDYYRKLPKTLSEILTKIHGDIASKKTDDKLLSKESPKSIKKSSTSTEKSPKSPNSPKKSSKSTEKTPNSPKKSPNSPKKSPKSTKKISKELPKSTKESKKSK